MPRPKSTDMASDSKGRTRVRPMPIAEFCDKVLENYSSTYNRFNHGPRNRMRRPIAFLTQNPSVKTTADLTTAIIPKFVDSCKGLSKSTILKLLLGFRTICNLAVEWGCLERNPFDGYPLTKETSLARSPKGPKLNGEQVESLLAYLKSGKDTWKGHRLYAFTATIYYAGLRTGEAMDLATGDCDLDKAVIRVRSRAKRSRPGHPPEVRIPPQLAEILTAWIPLRIKGKARRGGALRFGSKRSGDGRTSIPDEKEQKIVAEILRLRDEGLSVGQIACELNSQGVPTKQRATKWRWATVNSILKWEMRTDALAKDDRPEVDPLLLFPILNYVEGRRPSIRHASYNFLMAEMRAVRKALGIEGLTFESVRQAHLEKIRSARDLVWEEREQQVRPPASAGPLPAARQCPVELHGEGRPIFVYGEQVPPLTGYAYKLAEFAVERYSQDAGCLAHELVELVGSERPARLLMDKLKQPRFALLARVFQWDGKKGGMLRIINPGPTS